MNVVKTSLGCYVELANFTCVCIFEGKLLGDIKRKNTSIFVKRCEMKNESVVCWSLINCLKEDWKLHDNIINNKRGHIKGGGSGIAHELGQDRK